MIISVSVNLTLIQLMSNSFKLSKNKVENAFVRVCLFYVTWNFCSMWQYLLFRSFTAARNSWQWRRHFHCQLHPSGRGHHSQGHCQTQRQGNSTKVGFRIYLQNDTLVLLFSYQYTRTTSENCRETVSEQSVLSH